MTYGEIPVYVDNPAGGRMLRLVKVEMAQTYAESEQRALIRAQQMGYSNVVLFMREACITWGDTWEDDDTLDWEYDPSVKDARR